MPSASGSSGRVEFLAAIARKFDFQLAQRLFAGACADSSSAAAMPGVSSNEAEKSCAILLSAS